MIYLEIAILFGCIIYAAKLGGKFDKRFFKGKKCLVFDDILTQGHSYARFACALETLGAEVLGGYFLGKTILL